MALRQDGTFTQTIHVGGGVSDIVESGKWKVSGDVLELALSDDPPHPGLMKGLQISGNTLTVASNCVWTNGDYACSEETLTFSRMP
jgi:hypothetical protein